MTVGSAPCEPGHQHTAREADASSLLAGIGHLLPLWTKALPVLPGNSCVCVRCRVDSGTVLAQIRFSGSSQGCQTKLSCFPYMYTRENTESSRKSVTNL
jgi:hypothetical protein